MAQQSCADAFSVPIGLLCVVLSGSHKGPPCDRRTLLQTPWPQPWSAPSAVGHAGSPFHRMLPAVAFPCLIEHPVRNPARKTVPHSHQVSEISHSQIVPSRHRPIVTFKFAHISQRDNTSESKLSSELLPPPCSYSRKFH